MLAVDIGNSRTKFGTEDKVWTISTDKNQTVEELKSQISEFIDVSQVTDVSLSSVVPRLVDVWKQIFNNVYVLDIHNKLFKTIYPKPEEIAPDLVAAVIAANEIYGYPNIVLDAGTATVLCVTNDKAEFVGASIIPGIENSFNSLIGNASLLEEIELKYPESALGLSTQDALQSGTIMGEVFRIDGLIKKIESELGYPTKVIATGGWSEVLSKHLEHHCIYDSNLLIKGLFKAYEA